MAKKEPAAAPAPAPSAAPAAPAKSSSKRTWLLLTANSLLLIVLIQHSFIFLMVGILPSIVAYSVDREPGKPIFHTVFSFNLAGVLPYLGEVIHQGNSIGTVATMLSDVNVWFLMYSAAGLGWGFIWLAPWIAEGFLRAKYAQEIARRESFMNRLVEEWGPELRRKEEPAA